MEGEQDLEGQPTASVSPQVCPAGHSVYGNSISHTVLARHSTQTQGRHPHGVQQPCSRTQHASASRVADRAVLTHVPGAVPRGTVSHEPIANRVRPERQEDVIDTTTASTQCITKGNLEVDSELLSVSTLSAPGKGACVASLRKEEAQTRGKTSEQRPKKVTQRKSRAQKSTIWSTIWSTKHDHPTITTQTFRFPTPILYLGIPCARVVQK